MYKIMVTLRKANESLYGTWMIRAESMLEAVNRGVKYAYHFFNEENADYIFSVRVWAEDLENEEDA